MIFVECMISNTLYCKPFYAWLLFWKANGYLEVHDLRGGDFSDYMCMLTIEHF